MKKSAKQIRETARARHSQQLRSRIRGVIDEAVSPQVLLDKIWQHNVDLDRLVDDYAASHYAEGYRKPDVQNRSINRAIERGDHAVRAIHEHMYLRFLLAADVGFELGFAAANKLSRNG